MEARAVVVLEVVEGLLVGPEQRRRCPQLLNVCNIYRLGEYQLIVLYHFKAFILTSISEDH